MQLCLEPVDGIAHHVGRDEMAEVIVDAGLGLDVIALGQFFQIEVLGRPIDDIIGAAAEGQEGPAAEAVHMGIRIHGRELHLNEAEGPGLFDVQGRPEAPFRFIPPARAIHDYSWLEFLEQAHGTESREATHGVTHDSNRRIRPVFLDIFQHERDFCHVLENGLQEIRVYYLRFIIQRAAASMVYSVGNDDVLAIGGQDAAADGLEFFL